MVSRSAGVAARMQAFPAWRDLSGDTRRNLLLKLADLLERHAGELAALETLGNGAPTMVAPYIPPVAAQRLRPARSLR